MPFDRAFSLSQKLFAFRCYQNCFIAFIVATRDLAAERGEWIDNLPDPATALIGASTLFLQNGPRKRAFATAATSKENAASASSATSAAAPAPEPGP
jgi:hypothetical protein